MIRRPFSFSSKLFFSVMTLYAVFALSFLYYQYHQEKAHKVELLDNQLTMFNRQLFEHMSDSAFSLSDYISDHAVYYEMKYLRVTLIDSTISPMPGCLSAVPCPTIPSCCSS